MILTKECDFNIYEPTILDECPVIEMQKEFFSTNCKFNGTNNLDVFNNYIDWLANAINQTHFYNFCGIGSKKLTYLVNINNNLIGMFELIIYTNTQNYRSAHIIQCIRPSCRRLGYSKPLTKKIIHECWTFKKTENSPFFYLF